MVGKSKGLVWGQVKVWEIQTQTKYQQNSASHLRVECRCLKTRVKYNSFYDSNSKPAMSGNKSSISKAGLHLCSLYFLLNFPFLYFNIHKTPFKCPTLSQLCHWRTTRRVFCLYLTQNVKERNSLRASTEQM